MPTQTLHRRLDEIEETRDGFRSKLKSLTRKDGDKYAQVIREDGTFWCTCPDHQYRRRFCKHLRRLLDWIDAKAKKGVR